MSRAEALEQLKTPKKANGGTSEEAQECEGSTSTSPSQSLKRSHSHRKVTFDETLPPPKDEELEPVGRGPEAAGKAALRRSMQLLSGLYALRRIGKDLGESADQAGDGKAEQQETLLYSTLRDLEDTEASLRRTEAVLAQGQQPVALNGGARHATAVLSSRSLAVIRRKAQLLHQLEARLKGFEDACRRQQAILKDVMKGSNPPAVLVGVRKFLTNVVHKDGEPADCDKSDFEAFVSSFGLPKAHKAVALLKALVQEATDWWTAAALEEARKAAPVEEVQRIVAAAVGICSDENHPALIQARTVLADYLADKVLEAAERLRAKDEALVARSAAPQPDSARDTADAILAEIKRAVAMGAKAQHQNMTAAKNIETALRFEEKERHALKLHIFANAQKEKDEKLVAASKGVPKVGAATELALQIDREVEKTVTNCGVPSGHAHVQEATAISKALKDADVQRKRLQIREQRKAQQAD